MKLHKPAMAVGYQSIAFMNNPAIFQRKAVAAIARIPVLLFKLFTWYSISFLLNPAPKQMSNM
jgi:hypothetical protein